MAKKTSEPKPIGTVTHFYGHLGVAIVKFSKAVKTGARVRFKGATTDFEESVASMQYDHKPVSEAKKGQEVGIKVGSKVRDGDLVYEAE
ncbi:translation elongation factor-like protein [Candidatus Parcubacteria bacterium]|nr:MAG: translation elongation factor-like protein [Candidatus Parcubacteria bacterium]